MVDETHIQQLLKQLETEYGCPVQLIAEPLVGKEEPRDYGRGIPHIDHRRYFCSFADRFATVRRVEGLDQDYLFDVQKIEGDYTSLAKLQDRIERYNSLWGISSKYFTGSVKGQQRKLSQALGRRLKKEGYVNKCCVPFRDNLYKYIYKVRPSVPESKQLVTAEQLDSTLDRVIKERGPESDGQIDTDVSPSTLVELMLREESKSPLPIPDGQITPELLFSVVEELGLDYTKHFLSVNEGAVYAELLGPLGFPGIETKIADISLKLIE